MVYVVVEGTAVQGDGYETLRDLLESPRQSVPTQPAKPSTILPLSEAANTSTDRGARVPISPRTLEEEA